MSCSRITYPVVCLFFCVIGCSEAVQTPVASKSSVVFPIVDALPAELPLPQYRFIVGQHLVYRLTEATDLLTDKDDDPDPPSAFSWDVYVARQNGDGSRRLFIRKQVKLMRNTEDGNPEVRFENDVLGYCDIQADGRFVANQSLQSRSLFKVDPEQLFPPLPTNDHQKSVAGWTGTSEFSEQTWRSNVTALVDEQLTFAADVTSAVDANYRQTVTQQVNFDLARGYPTALARESKAEWSVNPWHSRSVTELISVETLSKAQLESFCAEAERYVELSSQWWRNSQESANSRTREECESMRNSMRERLVEAQAVAQLEEFGQLYDALLTLHDREAEWASESAQRRSELYAMEPIAWETTDFDGQTHRLADYRGKVVVLDFWYRGCGHCIKALPKMKQLAAEYAARDVAVLGMNKDRNDSDALFVIENFSMKYPSLRAEGIAKQYRIQSWPTFVVLDQKGKIAEYIEGNSEPLYGRLTSAIDRLLDKPRRVIDL